MSELTHLDAFGRATMVDVAGKQSSQRKAVAQAVLRLPSRVEQALRDSTVPKGGCIRYCPRCGNSGRQEMQ